jgi:quaternary ammonium compound-resistance protein SugE
VKRRQIVVWLLVIVAGLFEVGFALCLKASDGFSRPLPTVGFLVCAAISFGLLTTALRDLPVGTAYAVWTGIGAAGTATVGILWQGDPATALRIGAIALIITGVVGLNLAGTGAH